MAQQTIAGPLLASDDEDEEFVPQSDSESESEDVHTIKTVQPEKTTTAPPVKFDVEAEWAKFQQDVKSDSEAKQLKENDVSKEKQESHLEANKSTNSEPNESAPIHDKESSPSLNNNETDKEGQVSEKRMGPIKRKSRLDKLAPKTKKLNTLEKSRLDWNKHIEENKLQDELAYRRRSGYLDKQDFLARAEQRRDEIDIKLRAKKL